MKQYLVFAGTTEGRLLVEYLLKQGFSVYVCVATEYGKLPLPQHENMIVSSKRLEMTDMYHLMTQHQFQGVFDTTHPYATLVSENIKEAAEKALLPYYRVLRPSFYDQEMTHVISVASMEEAVSYLSSTTGNILVTTGSKELHKLCQLPHYKERIYARILPIPEMISHCFELGISGKHLICMQGPFSEALNSALLAHTNASYLLSKDSGVQGGFLEKVQSTKIAGIPMLLIRRPPSFSGISIEDILKGDIHF